MSARRTRNTKRRLHVRALALALAALALAAPASSARSWGWPPTSELNAPASPTAAAPMSMDQLTEEELLASRGQGAPRPVAVDDGVDWAAAVAWAGGAAVIVALIAFTAQALTTRRVPA